MIGFIFGSPVQSPEKAIALPLVAELAVSIMVGVCSAFAVKFLKGSYLPNCKMDLVRIWYNYKYSRTSVARTLIARLPWLFRTRS